MNDDQAVPADAVRGQEPPAPPPPTDSPRTDPSGTESSGGEGTTGERTGPPRRRRRRGGRGRGGRGSGGSRPAGSGEAADSDADPSDDVPKDDSGSEKEAKPAARPQQRRRPPAKPKADAGGAEPKGDEPAADEPTADEPKPRQSSRASTKPKAGQEAAASKDEATDEGSTDDAGPSEGTATTAAKRRRRRGGRGRSRKPAAEGAAAADAETPAEGGSDEQGADKAKPKSRSGNAKPKQPKEPKEPKAAAATSTRLSAKKSSRGQSSGRGRRRDALPLVRRVQDKVMVITEHGERDQIAVLEDRDLVHHYITRVGAHSMVGNIYMARVQNVLPGMEAAFLDIGRGRNAVLYAGEVNYDEEVEGQPQRIEHALKSGQAVMTQVTKDPIGGKGARLTAQVSLPGRYLVLVPNSQVFGISRRLPDEERKRLRAAVKKAKPDGHGIIVRTAAEGASEEDLAADVQRLVDEWDEIAKKAKQAKAPSVLYEEPELTVRVVRDLFNDEEFKEMVTDSPRIYEIVTTYLRDVAPDLLPKVRLHEGSLDVFEEYHVIEQIHKALDRKVWLPSGGYLVIDRTEALTVIDVNTGKHVGKTNLEETVVKTNLEAAEEVAKQLRLRDIGGMIIVDFIDMLLDANKKKVIATLKEALAKDKTRTQVFDISPLGLLEMTRKRVSAGLLESFSETCPTCEGRGILLTLEV